MRHNTTALLALLWFLFGATLPAAVMYVDSSITTSGDGSSWSKAKKTISEGVTAANSGDSIWVAEGKYSELVILKSNLSLYGGFAKTESSPAGRDLKHHKTIMDQSIARNGKPEDAAFVISEDENLLIDGFNITGAGIASGDYFAGVYISKVKNIIVTNTNFYNNATAGIKCWSYPGYSEEVFITNCNFTHNNYPLGIDGAVAENCRIYEDGPPLIRESAILRNSEIYKNIGFYDMSGTIENCKITQNSDPYNGGGIGIVSGGTVSNCLVIGNSSPEGGGIYYSSQEGGEASVSQCAIIGNSASVAGGGVYALNRGRSGGSIPNKISLRNCILSGNTAPLGGAAYLYGSECSCHSCTIADNVTSNTEEDDFYAVKSEVYVRETGPYPYPPEFYSSEGRSTELYFCQECFGRLISLYP